MRSLKENPEIFRLAPDGKTIRRLILTRSGRRVQTTFRIAKALDGTPVPDHRLANLAEAAYLSSTRWPRGRRTGRTIRTADLFSGCGAMSLGVAEACHGLGFVFRAALAIDINPLAIAIYKTNFRTASTRTADIREVLRGRVGAPPTLAERELKRLAGRIDIAVAGPPCQGHSNLNNHTRRRDPKNALYYRLARFADLVRPTHLIIENVPAVLLDRGAVVSRTKRALQRLGYLVEDGVVNVAELGVPQTRRRHLLVASLQRSVDLGDVISRYARKRRSVAWAIRDLVGRRNGSMMDRWPQQTKSAARRIRFLFERGAYDLPNWLRPPCHRFNSHTYHSVYGRLRWAEPAQTITSGFTCMGQGRFVHPSARRTLTPREAARLQFIPDCFKFGDIGIAGLAEMIGNAVPPKLTYVVALELLR